MKESIRQYVKEVYPKQYACLIAGKLHDDWQNVADHCIIQVVAISSLMDAMGFPLTTSHILEKVAVCHDWDKRLTKRPHDFNAEEVLWANKTFELSQVDPRLMTATTPLFLVHFQRGFAAFTEMVQFFIDDITKGDQIVSFDERIDEVSVRNPHPNDEIERELECPYWDAERKTGHAIESMILSLLKSRGFNEPIEILINRIIDDQFPT